MKNTDFQRVVLAIPPGLEVACVRIARRETGVRFDRAGPGLIQSKERIDDERVKALLDTAPRWSFGAFRLVAASVAMDENAMINATDALSATIAHADWTGKKYWLTADKGPVHSWAKGFLKCDFGLENNPGNYALTLRVSQADKGVHVLLGPSISVKKRFAYRRADVGASINPVLAACLARLMPDTLDGVALDPTAGSGTLLFERLLYSAETGGHAIDRSATAAKAFATNLQALSLDKQVRFVEGDAADPRCWTPCSSVICNLPFGIRVREAPHDLDALYLGILKAARKHLRPDGRILMTSSYKRGLQQAVKQMSDHFKILSRYRCEMGGLFYQVFVLSRI